MPAEPKMAAPAPVHRKFGAFAGVFTPSILTILGIILFQRLGYVVGAGGLLRMLLVMGLATAISVLTSMSLSAIATAIRVKGGGDYYIISRTLGPQFGGAIGLVLFLAQAASVAFYSIGFGEAVASMAGHAGDSTVIAVVAVGAIVVLGGLAYVGADWATRLQFVVMFALVLALISFFGGVWMRGSVSNLTSGLARPVESPGFWVIFAIFFPAVTGFTQGVSMSGDLRDPARSLPLGTFAAVGISTVIYFAAAVGFAACLPLSELSSNYNAMRTVSLWPWLIEVGVIAATLSSAMASFLGAPRILQSLASDNLFPILRPFAAGHGPMKNPRPGVLLTCALAIATVAAGSLNAVATVVGMCFLLSYGLLNYATFIEARAKSPSFRPTFKQFHPRLSFAGAGLCLAAGAAISPIAAAIAGGLVVAVHQFLSRAAVPTRWADSRYAHNFRRVRDLLIAMREGSPHSRDWRPHILAVCNEKAGRARLLRFADWIEGDSGFTTAVRIVIESRWLDREVRHAAQQELEKEIRDEDMETFALAVTAPDLTAGFRVLMQAYGLGPLHANTILMGAQEQFGERKREGDSDAPVAALRAALEQGRNVLLLEAGDAAWEGIRATREEDRRIDVWWLGDETSRLSLLLAHLTTRSEGWNDATIRVWVMGDEEQGGKANGTMLGRAESQERVRAFLEEVHIDAVVRAVAVEGVAQIAEHSRDASLVFMPFLVRAGRLLGPFGRPLEWVLPTMPVTALVVAAEDIDLSAPIDAEDTEAAAEVDAAGAVEIEPGRAPGDEGQDGTAGDSPLPPAAPARGGDLGG